LHNFYISFVPSYSGLLERHFEVRTFDLQYWAKVASDMATQEQMELINKKKMSKPQSQKSPPSFRKGPLPDRKSPPTVGKS